MRYLKLHSALLCIVLVCLCFQGAVVGFAREVLILKWKQQQTHLSPIRNSFSRLKSATEESAHDQEDHSLSRRSLIQTTLASSLGIVAVAGSSNRIGAGTFKNENPVSISVIDEDFKATSLPLLSLEDAYRLTVADSTTNAPQEIVFPFAQWPDPILRRPASLLSLPSSDINQGEFLNKIRPVAKTLQRTAHQKGAVGLAAQQCGIDVSLVYLQTNNNSKTKRFMVHRHQQTQQDLEGGIFLLNPRIVRRSPEREMLIWNEECLVLPPSFRATVLRDAEVTVEYETIFPSSNGDIPSLTTQKVVLEGELARAVQHEMQHDQGVLIVDHVDLEELPSYMQAVEAEGHRDRMIQAFDRSVTESSLSPQDSEITTTTIAAAEKVGPASWKEFLLPTANAEEIAECDETCMAERRARIEQRRAMMKQSRSNTRRQDVFELSQQRAALYNTTYRGAQCAPGIPCI